MRMKDNCLAHTVFLYFLKSPPVPHLPPRRGLSKRCRGIEKNNYTLHKGVPCREAGHVFCAQRKGFPQGGSCPRSGLMRDGLAVIALLRRSIGKRTPHPTSLRPVTFPQGGRLKPTLPKFLSKFRQKVQKCDFRLTFLRFYGMLKTKSLSTSVHCKEIQGAERGFPLSRVALLGSTILICG